MQFALSGIVLLLAAVGAGLLARGGAPETVPADDPPPTVQVLRVQPQRLKLPVRSQGVLLPVRDIELTAEVQGRVEALHKNFQVGGQFKAGEVLVRVAARDYALAIVSAETLVAEARRMLAEEQAAGQQARREWQALGQGQPTPLALREPHLQEAKAKLQQAEAQLAYAKFRRTQCEVRAPFAGRVKEKLTEVGQLAEVGKALGRIYADDAAEARLPLSKAQTAHLPEPGQVDGLKVLLTVEHGAVKLQRQARIVRREGIVDQATGLEYWVARLDRPLQPPAMLPGTFVDAEIEGRELDGVFELPRRAMNAAQEVWLVDADGKLELRRLTVLRGDADRVWVSGGLQADQRVVVSGMDAPVVGQKVVAEPADAAFGLNPP